MLIILLLVAFILSMFGWLFVYASYRIYDQRIYDEFSDKFYLFSRSLEDALGTTDRLSFDISTDSEIQSYLSTLKTSSGTYEALMASRHLETKLIAYPSKTQFIDSIELLSVGDAQYSIGNSTIALTQKEKSDLWTLGESGHGANVWAGHLDRQGSLYAARIILSSVGLSLEPIGLLMIRINMDKLLEVSKFNINSYKSKTMIVSDRQVIYPRNPANSIAEAVTGVAGNGYHAVTIDGDKYMMTYANFSNHAWTFVNLIEYNQIFYSIQIMKWIMIVLYAAVFLGVIVIGMQFAKYITKPLAALAAKFKEVGKGNLQLIDRETETNRDELGLINREFNKMVSTLDSLIKENYLHQIMLKETEYQALRAKMNPHFLYNTFESINWLAQMNGQDQISKMIKALGDLLRSSISSKECIALGEELELLRKYILIQNFRFQDKCEIVLDIDELLYGLEIPNFTLQPLVENAIHYGVEESLEVCRIRVGAEIAEGKLRLIVSDTGPGMDEQIIAKLTSGERSGHRTGVGLINIDQRIKLMHGEEYGITIRSTIGNGASVLVLLPIIQHEEEDIRTW
jgi:two-component system sensor histidine kinase YesM